MFEVVIEVHTYKITRYPNFPQQAENVGCDGQMTLLLPLGFFVPCQYGSPHADLDDGVTSETKLVAEQVVYQSTRR